MNYPEEVEEKIKLLINTFEELSKNPLYSRIGRETYASSKLEVLHVFYGGESDETDKL